MMVKVFCILIAGLFLGPLLAFEHVHANNRAVITSASEPDYPPFCVVSPDGKAGGFSVELLREALSSVNLDVTFKIGQWDKIKAELRDGDIQVLPLVGRTPEREAIYDFTFPYLSLHGAVFVRKGDTRIIKVSDLADKTVVVMRGDNAEEFARRTNISAHIVTVDTFKQAMELLDAGTYDAVIAQRVMGLQLLRDIKIKNVVPSDIVLNDFRQDFCFAVRSGDKALLSRLNEGLAIIIANGTFDRLHKQWFSPLLQQQITFKDVWKYVLYILIPLLIAVTLLSIALLRREIKRKTNSLNQEIDRRKQSEEVLKKMQFLLNETGRMARIGGWEFDVDTMKLLWTEELYRIHEVDSTYIPSVGEAIAFYTPESRPIIEDAVKRAIEHGYPFDVELEIITAKSNKRWVHAIGQSKQENGKIKTVLGAFHDITEQKLWENELRESEEKFRNLFNNSEIAMFRTRLDGSEVLDVNQKFLDLVGRTRVETIGKPSRILWVDPKEREKMVETLTAKGRVSHLEFQMLNEKKGVRDCITSLVLFQDQGILEGSILDITKHKKLEEQLRQTQKLESIGTLAGGIAHDFNNLLQGVFGYISMAKLTHDQKDKSLAMLDQAEEALHMSVNLTTQLLTFSKGGKPVMKLIRLEPTIENAVKFALSGSHTDYRLNIDPDLWPVKADAGQLAQVIQNIVLNADQAMPLKGTIELIAANRDVPGEGMPSTLAKGRYVMISIRDTGVGIPQEFLLKIFDPYFTTKQKGSGLGLTTSYSIIKNHEGIIEVSSKPNRGTAFTIYLPASRGAEIAAGPTTSTDATTKMLKVLLMDDEDIVRNVAKEMISALGHEVEVAEDGRKAIELFQKARDKGRPFDLVILDLTVKGGMGGEEAIAQIRDIDPEVRAVVSSGYADSPVVANYLTYGFSAVLNKPYRIDSLKDCLGQFHS